MGYTPMKKTRRGRTRIPAVLVFSVILVLLFGTLAFADPSVSLISPTTALSGQVHLLGVVTEADGMSYAILYVDSAGRCVTNEQPLRFELDTRGIPDGAHLLKVEVFDKGGSLAVSPEVKVVVRNTAHTQPPTPRTTPKVPSVSLANTPAKGTTTAKSTAPAPVTPQGKTNMAATPPAPPVASSVKQTPTTTAPVSVAQSPAAQATPVTPNATGSAAKPTATAPAVTPTPGAASYTATPGQKTITVTVNGPLPKTGKPEAKASPAPAATDPQFIAVPLTPTPANARPVSVLMDGKAVTFTPQSYIVDGHAMLVLRALVAHTGGTLRWDNTAKQATAAIGNAHYLLTPCQRIVLRDGETITLTQPIALTNGRLFIPATAWRDLFGGTVAYDPQTRQIVLHSTENTQASVMK